MPQQAQYFIQKANHCTRLARLIQDPVIKAELQTLAREFMAEAGRICEPEAAGDASPVLSKAFERRFT
jgi:hypothetical protein